MATLKIYRGPDPPSREGLDGLEAELRQWVEDANLSIGETLHAGLSLFDQSIHMADLANLKKKKRYLQKSREAYAEWLIKLGQEAA